MFCYIEFNLFMFGTINVFSFINSLYFIYTQTISLYTAALIVKGHNNTSTQWQYTNIVQLILKKGIITVMHKGGDKKQERP